MPSAKALRGLRLMCPKCNLELSGTGTDLRSCAGCESEWRLTGGKWWFGGEDEILAHEPTDSFKSRLKLYPGFYTAATNLVGPVYPQWFLESRRLRKSLDSGTVAVDVGAGNFRFSEHVINVDMMPYPNVDVVSHADALPFASNSVDVLVSIAVLEHVPDPQSVIVEFERVLRPGGTAYVYVPFIQGFHAAPHDYQRFTLPGLKHALRNFELLRSESFGPTSGLVWVLGDWLSILLCFGSATVQRTLALLFTVLLSPLKFLDVMLRHFPGADAISTGFLLVLKKRESSPPRGNEHP